MYLMCFDTTFAAKVPLKEFYFLFFNLFIYWCEGHYLVKYPNNATCGNGSTSDCSGIYEKWHPGNWQTLPPIILSHDEGQLCWFKRFF